MLAGYNMERIDDFVISGFASLHSIDILNNCFAKGSGVFTISNCSSLSTFHLGNNAFNSYKRLAVNGLPSLQSIVFDGYNFETSNEFSFDSMYILV